MCPLDEPLWGYAKMRKVFGFKGINPCIREFYVISTRKFYVIFVLAVRIETKILHFNQL